MFQDQNRRFARHSRNISVSKFIRHEIAIEHDPLAAELFDDFRQPHQIDGSPCTRVFAPALHRLFLKIQSTAAARSMATKSGAFGHFAICHVNSPSPYPVRTRMLFPPALCPSSMSERRSPTKKDLSISIECSSAARRTIPSFGLRQPQVSAEPCGQ